MVLVTEAVDALVVVAVAAHSGVDVVNSVLLTNAAGAVVAISVAVVVCMLGHR